MDELVGIYKLLQDGSPYVMAVVIALIVTGRLVPKPTVDTMRSQYEAVIKDTTAQRDKLLDIVIENQTITKEVVTRAGPNSRKPSSGGER